MLSSGLPSVVNLHCRGCSRFVKVSLGYSSCSEWSSAIHERYYVLCVKQASMATFVSLHVLARDKSAATPPFPSEPKRAGMKEPRWGPPPSQLTPAGHLPSPKMAVAAPLRSAPPASRETCGGAGAARCKWRGGGPAARAS